MSLRLRHPKGVSTLDVDLSDPSVTVSDLQSLIFSLTEIEPSKQELKCGYPPKTLNPTLFSDPDAPASILGIGKGEQVMVSESKSASTPAPPKTATGATAHATPIPSAPRPSPPSPLPISSTPPDTVSISSGTLVHRIVPDDNSCLFSAIGTIFEGGIQAAGSLRKVVADAIRNDPITWDEATLGRPREDYISTILKPSTWGGAIELSIFSTHYSTLISSIDVETGRVDTFGLNHSPPYTQRAIVLYSGIHYDAITLSPGGPDLPVDFHERVFSEGGGGEVLEGAEKLAGILRGKRKFTNTTTFDLRCQICKQGLKGEKEAREHAKATGHVEFGEY